MAVYVIKLLLFLISRDSQEVQVSYADLNPKKKKKS